MFLKSYGDTERALNPVGAFWVTVRSSAPQCQSDSTWPMQAPLPLREEVSGVDFASHAGLFAQEVNLVT